MSDEMGLFALDIPPENGASSVNWGQGPTEVETRAAIQEIEATAALTGSRRTIKQLCIALSVSIDKGNNKGRAIANEAGQLFAMMQQLDPIDPGDAEGSTTYSPELEKLFNAFASGPALQTDPELDQAPPGD